VDPWGDDSWGTPTPTQPSPRPTTGTGTITSPSVVPSSSRFNTIFEAARDGTENDIRYFHLSQGVSINAKDPMSGATVLHIVAKRNPNVEVLRYLVNVANVNATDREGKTPLDVANTEAKRTILRVAGGRSGSGLPQAPGGYFGGR
jgi:hypothetical protein